MVEKMAAIVFIMVAIAAFLDLFDVFFCLALPDNVFVKSIGNLRPRPTPAELGSPWAMPV